MDLQSLDEWLDKGHPPHIFAERLCQQLTADHQSPVELAEQLVRDHRVDRSDRERSCRAAIHLLEAAQQSGRWQGSGLLLSAFQRAQVALSSGAFSLFEHSVPVPFQQGTSGVVRCLRAGLDGQGAGEAAWLPEVKEFVDTEDEAGARKFLNAPALARLAALRLLASFGVSLDNAALWATLDVMLDERYRFKGDSVGGGIVVAAVAAALGHPVGRDTIGDTALSFALNNDDGRVGALNEKVDGILRENARRGSLPLCSPIRYLIVSEKVGWFDGKGLEVKPVPRLEDAIEFLTFDEFRSYTDCLSRSSPSPLADEDIEKMLASRGIAFVPYKHYDQPIPVINGLLAQLVRARTPRGNDLRWRQLPVPVLFDVKSLLSDPDLRGGKSPRLGKPVCKAIQAVARDRLSPYLANANRVETYLREGRFILVFCGLERLTDSERRALRARWLPRLRAVYNDPSLVFVGREWDLRLLFPR